MGVTSQSMVNHSSHRARHDDPFLAEVSAKAKAPVEAHLHIRFAQWQCLDAISQVVSGTVWYLKMDVGTPCALWIKAFVQPTTETFEVVGVDHSRRLADRLQMFHNNCNIDCLAPVDFDFIDEVPAIEDTLQQEPAAKEETSPQAVIDQPEIMVVEPTQAEILDILQADITRLEVFDAPDDDFVRYAITSDEAEVEAEAEAEAEADCSPAAEGAGAAAVSPQTEVIYM